MKKYNIYLNKRWLTHIYTKLNIETLRNDLIKKEGYDKNIVIRKVEENEN